MKRTTKLSGDGSAGKIEIVIRTVSDDLTRDEVFQRHNALVESVHKAMTDMGCFAHLIEVK